MSRTKVSASLLLALVIAVAALAASRTPLVNANEAANLDQCANGSTVPGNNCNGTSVWVNGDLNASKSHFREGDVVPYRMRLTGITAGSHTLTFQWDTTKQGKHALDYIATFNTTETLADPCQNVSPCSFSAGPTEFDLAIPTDPAIHFPVVNGNTATQLAGVVKIEGVQNASLVAVSAAECAALKGTADGLYCLSGSYSGDSSTAITINFTTTATQTNPVVTWGGHIASQRDWGTGTSAVNISGSPYHMRLSELDGSGGNQDRALTASAVAGPPTISTQVSATSVTIGTSVTDTATLVGTFNSVMPTGSVTFFVCGPSTTATPCITGDLTRKNLGNATLSGSGGTATATSASFAPTATGTYCFAVTYGGDSTYPGADATSTTNECVTVGKNSPSIATTLSASSVSIGTPVHDSATLTGATATAGGTVTYTVYNDNACSQGAQSAGTKTVTNGVVPDSNPITFTAAGTYFWQAAYSGDTNNGGATSSCQSEVLTVGKNSPTIATTLSAASITVGGTASDSATLSGATNDAGGTVTYAVYPSQTDCTNKTSGRAAGTVTVSNGLVPNSNTLTFTQAGSFYWQAVYSGDTNNNGASSVCADEQLVVGKATPSINTTPSAGGAVGTTLSDTAAVSGGASPTGTVTFRLYLPSDTTCSSMPFFTATNQPLNGGTASSGNSSATSVAGTYHWVATYNGDANNNAVSSGCTEEPVVIGKLTPSIATTLSATTAKIGDSVHDSATLSGATANAGGTVTYTVYSDNACTAGARDAGTVTVTNGVVPDSNALPFTTAGTFNWQAVYGGDANNNGATSACQSEVLTVGKNSPTIATTLSATTAAIGGAVHDSAALTGATSDAGGTVTYTVYSDNACSQGAQSAGTKTVTNGVVPDSNSITFASAGTFNWQAVYSGDANNNGASSACQSEVLTIARNSPTIGTQLSAPSITVGGTASDSATLSGATNDAGGTVTYAVYPSQTDCTNKTSGRAAGTVTVSNGLVPNSNTLTFTQAGSFYWQAVYSGDTNNNGASSVCADEQLVVNPASPSIGTTLSATSANIGDSVHDSAALTGATSDAGGTVTYTVYSDNQCKISFASAGTKAVTNGVVPDSDPVLFTQAGTFYWQAAYSGDANNGGATSACQSEVLTVGKNTPTISTVPGGAVVIGSGSALTDSATLSGATSNAGGTITFTLYAPDGTTVVDTETVSVNGNGTYSTPTGYLPTATGTYQWVASYSGDANNNGAISNKGDEPEKVNPASPSITTQATPATGIVGNAVLNDTATLSGGVSPTGTITFTLTAPDHTTVYTETQTVNGNGPYTTTGTGTGSDLATQVGSYTWSATYSGDSNNTGATDNGANETIVVSPASPSIATTLSSNSITAGGPAHDSATLSGATTNAGGTVAYTVYTDSVCSQGAQSAGTKSVTNGSVPDSDAITFNNAGTFYWQAAYSGDANNSGATSLCTSEVLVVNPASPSITTQATPATGTVGSGVLNDTATLSSGVNPTGTITFTLTAPDHTTVYTDVVAVNGNGTYSTSTQGNNPGGFTPTQAGTYAWHATYSGDPNNNGASDDGTNEAAVVGKASPSIGTTPSAGGNVGVQLSDTASVTGGASPTGTVTFNLHAPGTSCQGTPFFTSTVALTGGSAGSGNSPATNQAGTWQWTATYNGDGNNNAASSGCGDEAVTVTQPTQSQVLPTGTTCQQYQSGSVGVLSTIQYGVKSGKINSVSPGVFFYYTTVTASSGSLTVNIGESDSPTYPLFAVAKSGTKPQILVYNAADCSTFAGATVSSPSTGTASVTISNATAGQQFIISVKYDPSTVSGNTPPATPPVVYTFTTSVTGGSVVGADTASVNLAPKP